MILNVVKYSSAFITVLFGFHFLKTERERIHLLLKEKDDKLLNCDKRINILEKELVNEKNKYNALIRLLPNLEPEPSPDTTPYNSLDEDVEGVEGVKDKDEELDTDKTNYDNEIDNGIVNDLQNDISEDSIEELVHSNEIDDNDNDTSSNRGLIEFTE
tara:strand:- start:33 stop:506 length:474 start_codon:yes stop_codon:yes gene_type:complete